MINKKLKVLPRETRTIEHSGGVFTLPEGRYHISQSFATGENYIQEITITKHKSYYDTPLWKVLNDKVEKEADLSQRRSRHNEGNNKKAQESSKKTPENNKRTQKRKWNSFRRMDKD